MKSTYKLRKITPILFLGYAFIAQIQKQFNWYAIEPITWMNNNILFII